VEDPDRRTSPSDKSVPPEVLEGRERKGREVAFLWIGVFALVAVVAALIIWLTS
jgi:predicted nucleic acid-binding Zn ribbon protein